MSFMPKPTSSALAADLVRQLAACRDVGEGDYPLSLDRLAAQIDAPPDLAAVYTAVAGKPFTARALVAVKSLPDAPVSLIEDLAALADCPLTLAAALAAKGLASIPPWLPKQLAGGVQKPLRSAFLEAITKRLADGTLPEFVGTTPKGKAAALYHRDRPPPPPQDVRDAERLVAHVRQASALSVTVPLLTLDGLKNTGGVSKGFTKAIKAAVFADAVAQVKCGSLGTIVVPKERIGEVATGRKVLDRLVADCSRPGVHAFPATDLVAKLGEPLKTLVKTYLTGDDTARFLPHGYGYIEAGKGKRYFFRLADVRASAPTASRTSIATPTDPPPADFAAAFDAAFARLDRDHGSNNFVSMVDLRADLKGFSREAFDAGLRLLRADRRYVLTSDERYGGLTPEQQAAAIREEGEFLLHVSRGRS